MLRCRGISANSKGFTAPHHNPNQPPHLSFMGYQISHEHSIITLKTSHCSRTNTISSCIETEKTTALHSQFICHICHRFNVENLLPPQSDFAIYIDIRYMIGVHFPPLLISRFGVPRVLKDLVGCVHGIGDQSDKIRIYTAPSFP